MGLFVSSAREREKRERRLIRLPWTIISKNLDCHRQRLFCELSESKESNQLEINRNRTFVCVEV